MTADPSNPATATDAAPSTRRPVSVLFVCLGNICRSTMAEGVFQSLTTPSHPLIKTIDSCGTGAYHIGDPPDPRTMSMLRANGITSYKHAARQFNPAADFETFDFIVAMDESNLYDLEQLKRREVRRRGGEESGMGKVMLLSAFGGGEDAEVEEVQDPYYSGKEGFARAFEQCVRFGRGFLRRLEKGEVVDDESRAGVS